MDSIVQISLTDHSYTDPYPGRAGTDLEWIECGRCGGRGHFTHYESLNGGRCFECHGAKGTHTPIKTLRARESSRLSALRKADREWAAEAQRHNDAVAALAEVDPEAAAAWGAEAFDSGNEFARSIWDSSFKYELSEKQSAALVASIRRSLDRVAARAAAAAAAAPVVEGRREIEGEVSSAKLHESDFGSTWKMIVALADGSRVWSTVPSSILSSLDAEAGAEGAEWTKTSERLKGRRVRLTVTVEASRDDAAFGFGKRPAKAVLLPAD